ncbi:hypothetical protein FF2_024899 [Malus domestica]
MILRSHLLRIPRALVENRKKINFLTIFLLLFSFVLSAIHQKTENKEKGILPLIMSSSDISKAVAHGEKPRQERRKQK